MMQSQGPGSRRERNLQLQNLDSGACSSLAPCSSMLVQGSEADGNRSGPARPMPNIRGGGCSVAWPLVAAFIVIALLTDGLQLEAREPAFKAEGRILYEVFLPDGEERRWSREFKVVVHGCRWTIESYDVATGAYGMKMITNGLIYSARRVSEPTRSDYTVVIEDDDVPFADTSGISVIWLAYASACYLATVEDGRYRPVWHLDDPGLRTENYTVPGLLATMNGGLPQELAFVNEGVIYGRAKGGRAIIRARSPLENLPTNAVYRVNGTTNVGELTLPTSFQFERYSLWPHDFTIFRRIARISGTLTSVSAEVKPSDLEAEIEGTIMVTDKRFEKTEPQVGLLHYWTTNLQGLRSDDTRILAEKELALRNSRILKRHVSPGPEVVTPDRVGAHPP
jgi:hypothetical protein